MLPPQLATMPPVDLAGWVAQFDIRTLPVLDDTVDQLEVLRPHEDDVDAHGLVEAVGTDPLLTLKVLAHVAEVRRQRVRAVDGEVETLTEALVMLGIPPFFRAFEQLQTVGACLAGQPDALRGFERVLRRSHRASRFAVAFAVHRMDHDVAVIGEAALLHDFAELLVWLRAPALALYMARLQDADPTLRSAEVQRRVLHVELAELQHALMQRWGLPRLLVDITDHHPAENSQVRNVQLAIRLARHSAAGWDNAALPDDIADIARLLNMGVDPTWRLVRDIDAG